LSLFGTAAFLAHVADRRSKGRRPIPPEKAWYIVARAVARSDFVPDNLMAALVWAGLPGSPGREEVAPQSQG
jgi:hypothetical protein